MSTANWTDYRLPPAKAGRYLVGNRETHSVSVARWAPKKREWKFPSAAQAFDVQVWADLPAV